MTVEELMEKLKKMPQDAEVVCASCYEDYKIEEIEYHNKDYGEVCGEEVFVMLK